VGLEQANLRPALSALDRSRKPGQSTTDDRDPAHRDPSLSSPLTSS
jgi:hypothetical protein